MNAGTLVFFRVSRPMLASVALGESTKTYCYRGRAYPSSPSLPCVAPLHRPQTEVNLDARLHRVSVCAIHSGSACVLRVAPRGTECYRLGSGWTAECGAHSPTPGKEAELGRVLEKAWINSARGPRANMAQQSCLMSARGGQALAPASLRHQCCYPGRGWP